MRLSFGLLGDGGLAQPLRAKWLIRTEKKKCAPFGHSDEPQAEYEGIVTLMDAYNPSCTQMEGVRTKLDSKSLWTHLAISKRFRIGGAE
jgi:hypothetical protein